MKNSNPLYLCLLFAAFVMLGGCMSCEQLPDDDRDHGIEDEADVGVDVGDDAGRDIDRDAGGDEDGGDAETGSDTGGDTGGDTGSDGDAGGDAGGDADVEQPDADAGLCGDCSHLDDDCNMGVCHEETETCVAEPINVGQSCDDGLYCTVNEVCSAQGQCLGQQRDCSHLDELCRVGVCEEDGKGCVARNASEKASCDTGQFCVVNEKCVFGECVGEPRDCSYLDDECHVGVCNEAGEKCVELYMCSACEDGLPTADAGSDQSVIPNTEVILDGTGSSDPNGQQLSYQWSITSRPDGSSASITDPTSSMPTLLADVSGVFQVCLTVANEEQCTSQESCMNITVAPLADLHIELVWRLDADPVMEPIDLDLHYRTPTGSWFSGIDGLPCRDQDKNADSVWWCVPNPDWGGGADGDEPDGIEDNDPVLDVDNLVGDGPENINQELLFDGDGFRVGVHNFRDHGHGPEEARVRIYINGQLEFEAFETIECMDFWEVAEINISNGGTEVEIIALDEEHFQGPVGYCGDDDQGE